MKIFYIAEITGKAGVWAVKKNIAAIKSAYRPDFIIANAHTATGAGGLGAQHAGYLKKMGIDCITGGDYIFQKKDLIDALPHLPFVVRPLNMPDQSPGRGYRCFSTKCQTPLIVVSLLGRVGRHRLLAENPFSAMEKILPELQRETPCIIVDFSAFATAEKQTMAFFLEGKVSALIGSGTGAATADERVLSDKQIATAYITDAGRTGSFDSVGGYDPAGKIQEYRTGLYEYPQETWKRVCVQGLIIELDENGAAHSISRVMFETAKEN